MNIELLSPSGTNFCTVKYIFLVVCKITGRMQLGRNRLVITRGRKNSDSIPRSQIPYLSHGWMALETDRNRQGMNRMFRCPSHTRRGVPAGVQIYMIKNVSSYFLLFMGSPQFYIQKPCLSKAGFCISIVILKLQEQGKCHYSGCPSTVRLSHRTGLRTGPHHHR